MHIETYKMEAQCALYTAIMISRPLSASAFDLLQI